MNKTIKKKEFELPKVSKVTIENKSEKNVFYEVFQSLFVFISIIILIFTFSLFG